MFKTIRLPGDLSIEIEYDSTTYDPNFSSLETVELAVQCIDETGLRKVIDIGTGTGLLGLAVKKMRPRVKVTLADIEDDALIQAAANADRNKLHVKFRKSDLYPSSAAYPLIIANLPTFTDKDMRMFDLHGPDSAYFASSEDPLALYRKLIRQMPHSSFLCCEVQPQYQADFMEMCEGRVSPVKRTNMSFALFKI